MGRRNSPEKSDNSAVLEHGGYIEGAKGADSRVLQRSSAAKATPFLQAVPLGDSHQTDIALFRWRWQ